MNLSFEPSKAYELVYKALDYRSLRQDLIASNIANVDTPFYRPRDVDFEQYLAREEKRIFEAKPQTQLRLAETSPRHLEGRDFEDESKAVVFFRDGHLARNDGNSVDLDVETSEMGKNSVMYQALTAALRKHRGIFSYAIDSILAVMDFQPRDLEPILFQATSPMQTPRAQQREVPTDVRRLCLGRLISIRF